MKNRLFNLPTYGSIMAEHIWNMLELLLENDIEFRLLCYKSDISFEPELPTRVTDTMGDMVLFDISNYSFESAVLMEDVFHFGAGFGSDNIGATVIIPLLSIAQIFLDEIPITLNFVPQGQKHSDKEVAPAKEEKKLDSSMEALLKNPNNQHLLKKRVKK